MSNKKKQLGQFFTTQADHILQGLEDFVKNKEVIDPFAGNGDLLKWANQHEIISFAGYDIDQKYCKNGISYNDSLINIPKTLPFVLTNPPYLGKNKMFAQEKKKYSLDQIDDLYLLAIKNIIQADFEAGIIIVPVNFFSAENSQQIRKQFLEKYQIHRINYFSYQVFEDTTYNVVAFSFSKDINNESRQLPFYIFSENQETPKLVKFQEEKKYDYQIAGAELFEINNAPSKLKIKRLTEEMMLENKGNTKISCYFNDLGQEKQYKITSNFQQTLKNNIITLMCIDQRYQTIQAFLADKPLVGKNTSRNMAFLLIEGASKKQQKQLVEKFNAYLGNWREKYHSLFLTNFRDHNRKRISFELCYHILNYLVN